MNKNQIKKYKQNSLIFNNKNLKMKKIVKSSTKILL